MKYDQEIADLVKKYLKTDEDYRRLLESGLPSSLSSLPNEDWGISSRITISLVEDWFKGQKKIDL